MSWDECGPQAWHHLALFQTSGSSDINHLYHNTYDYHKGAS
jgi:hypothetical protein